MNYEIAKALKKVGFPQTPGAYIHRETAPDDGHAYTLEPCYKPTLEELIEACGIRFKSLHKYLNHKWGAKHDNGREFEGATPAEAVARLWISSQK